MDLRDVLSVNALTDNVCAIPVKITGILLVIQTDSNERDCVILSHGTIFFYIFGKFLGIKK